MQVLLLDRSLSALIRISSARAIRGRFGMMAVCPAVKRLSALSLLTLGHGKRVLSFTSFIIKMAPHYEPSGPEY